MPFIRVLLPGSPEAKYVLKGDKVTVGRRPDNTIQIIDRSVSAHHAEFLLTDDHYRLHDLGSTNLTFVDGQQVSDFHLHSNCKVTFGTVVCEFNASPSEPEGALTPAQMERDLAFLRAENQERRHQNDTLQRRIDMLSSARLITGKNESTRVANSEELKRMAAERDEMRFQNTGLKVELEKVREELSVALHERDAARQSRELMQMVQRVQPDKGASEQDAGAQDKGTTQRIIYAAPPRRD